MLDDSYVILSGFNGIWRNLTVLDYLCVQRVFMCTCCKNLFLKLYVLDLFNYFVVRYFAWSKFFHGDADAMALVTNLKTRAFNLYEENPKTGICYRCDHTQPAEADAVKDRCEECGEYTVFSAAQIIQRINL